MTATIHKFKPRERMYRIRYLMEGSVCVMPVMASSVLQCKLYVRSIGGIFIGATA